ncbi:MAG: lysophospholipid acyltransferase family protein [Acidobacteriia bacterium]|nr:lysophospholipid acyltransferase family protein [Terriglobia bacterium]
MSRWYAHGWNTATSLRLILTITPRVPRRIVPVLGAVTAAICLAVMKRERQAAIRNLRRVLRRGGWPLYRVVWGLFYNFGRFMASYCELRSMTPESLEPRLARDPPGEKRLREALEQGSGALVLTAHLGNWEVGTLALQGIGRPVLVAMQVERTNAAERWLNRLRVNGGVRVLRVGRDPASALVLRAALARSEIVAMQGDRATGDRVVEVGLFGAPFRFPLGPFLLAYGCDVPMVPTFVVQEGWWRWRSEVGEPVRFPRTSDRGADIAAGVAQYAAQLEQAVRRHPDQWFNFYDLWPSTRSALSNRDGPAPA